MFDTRSSVKLVLLLTRWWSNIFMWLGIETMEDLNNDSVTDRVL